MSWDIKKEAEVRLEQLGLELYNCEETRDTLAKSQLEEGKL